MKKKWLPALHNPYRARGQWYKGAFHIHTTCSDGKLTPRQAVAAYAAKGCRVVGISDHGRVTEVPPRLFPGVLLIPNVEVSWPHLLLIGTKAHGKIDFKSLNSALKYARKEKSFVVLCHPEWSNHTMAEVRRAWPVNAMETYNHGCEYENATGYGDMHWNLLLRSGRRLWGFADDDAHFSEWSPEYDGGWVMIRAPKLTQPAVLKALKDGSYYSSQGPRLLDFSVRGNYFHIRCSPVVEVRALVDGVGAGMVRFSRKASGSWKLDRSKCMWKGTTWVRFELKDANGKLAWTNPLYVK